ncbi:MAG: hypothetical protein MJE66_04795 [Proteobacteria bacterium]|nr:hypothetical protein [Pseudomonadota bacterium]
MGIPHIKGIALMSVVDDVTRLLESGHITQEQLDAELKPEDLELLGESPMPTLWYSLASYGRLLDFLWTHEGNRDRDYLVKRGADAAERILASGIYAKVVETAEKWGGDQMAKAIIGFSKSFYDFMDWHLLGSLADDHFKIEVEEAEDYPEVAQIAAEGFMRVLMGRTAEAEVVVSSHRPASDRVVFELRRTG